LMKNVQNILGGGTPENIRPVVSHGGGNWVRLGAPEVKILPDGRTTASWLVTPTKKEFDFAFCYPYGRNEVDNLINDSNGYWKADVIGLSHKDRPLIRLSNSSGNLKRTSRGLYLIARQHSGEMSGSWVLDGFLREVARLKIKDLVIWAVPLSNIDGVTDGDYGKDNFPYDLNRAWGSPAMRHEVLVLQRDLQRWNKRCTPLLAIDFHSPGGCEADGAYFFNSDPKKYPKEHKLDKKWADRMAKEMGPEYTSKNHSRFIDYRSRWETPTFHHYCNLTCKSACLSMETPYGISNGHVLTQDDYRLIGKRMVRAVVKAISDG